VSLINLLPLQQWGTNGDVFIGGDAAYVPGHMPRGEMRTISPDYFRSFRIPLIAGRFFDEHDQGKSESVVIINQAFAQRYFSTRNPIGNRLSSDQKLWRTIVGVVGDVRQAGLARPPEPEMYLPYPQGSQASKQSMSLVVRTSGEPTDLISSVRNELRNLDPNQPVFNVMTMKKVIEESVSDRRLNMALLGIFAGLALILSSIGIYSVMSYTVTQGTREIGIRMALGARTGQVRKLVVGNGLRLSLVGVVIGLFGAFGLTRLMSALLFGVTPTDPLIFVGSSVSLVLVGVLACYIPARRATKIDPLVALRHE
jgi:predicted permease